MVPFWRRRLLAVTLPMAMLLGTVVYGLACLGVEHLRYDVIMGGESFVDPTWFSFLLAWIVAEILIATSVLTIAKPFPRNLRGASYWFTRTVFGLRTSIMALAAFALSLSYFLPFFVVSLGLLILPGASLAIGFGLTAGTRHVAPREASLRCMERRGAILAGGLLTIAIPVGAALVPMWDANHDTNHHDIQSTLVSHLIMALALFLISGLIMVFFTNELALRHAPYHERHCHSCGYDLLGVETTACPECDHPISTEQRNHLAQLASNGSHATSSSPTAST